MIDIELLEKRQKLAQRIAEYLALASDLKDSSPKCEYQKANALSLELAIWLPAEVYREIVAALVERSNAHNPFTAAIIARRILCNDEELMADELGFHAPGIGKRNKVKKDEVQ